jgi:hypothetical protein
MRTPSRAAISLRSRESVQLGRSATAAASRGRATRNAASLFTGAGPGATRALSAATPPRMKSLRHRRTVSSRTPNASAIRRLVQPESVSNTARARSASPRSREPASAVSAPRCSSVAESGDRPVMSCTCNPVPAENQHTKRWSTRRSLLRTWYALMPRSASDHLCARWPRQPSPSGPPCYAALRPHSPRKSWRPGGC